MIEAGEFNLGQSHARFARQTRRLLAGIRVVSGDRIAGLSVGSSLRSHDGSAGAGGSWDEVIHRTVLSRRTYYSGTAINRRERCRPPRGHRADWRVYRPEYEGHGNYVPHRLRRRTTPPRSITMRGSALHPAARAPPATCAGRSPEYISDRRLRSPRDWRRVVFPPAVSGCSGFNGSRPSRRHCERTSCRGDDRVIPGLAFEGLEPREFGCVWQGRVSTKWRPRPFSVARPADWTRPRAAAGRCRSRAFPEGRRPRD